MIGIRPVLATNSTDSNIDPLHDATLQCLPGSEGFFNARLQGSIDTELNWRDAQLNCTGAIRPNGDGLRIRFSHRPAGATNSGNRPNEELIFVFGITDLKEGKAARALPVNLTVIREGQGEFFATQGDSRCTADSVTQEPLQGIPLKQRSYRIVVRGFCTQPARAIKGDGLILVTRFDFAGRADFASEDPTPDPTAK